MSPDENQEDGAVPAEPAPTAPGEVGEAEEDGGVEEAAGQAAGEEGDDETAPETDEAAASPDTTPEPGESEASQQAPAPATTPAAAAPVDLTKAPPAGARPVNRPGTPRAGQSRGGRPVARTAQGRAVQAARASGTTPKPPPAPKPVPSRTPRPAGGAGAGPPKTPRPPTPAPDDEARPKDAREKRAREIERRKAAAAAAARAKRKRQIVTLAGSGLGVVLLVVVIVVLVTSGGGTPAKVNIATTDIPSSTVLSSPPATAAGPEGVPLPVGTVLAPIDSTLTGQTKDGITCGSEAVVYHIHVHLTIFVDGAARQVPGGVGIVHPLTSSANGAPFVNNGQCFYWLHTHAADGIVHVESPQTKTFSLGDFFDLWGQPLSMSQVGPASGAVTIYYNGKLYTGTDPRSIPLDKHGQIQIEVGTPLVAPVTVTNWGNL